MNSAFLYIVVIFVLTMAFQFSRYNFRNDNKHFGVALSLGLLLFAYVVYIGFSVFRYIADGFGGTDAIVYKGIFDLATQSNSFVDFCNARREEIGFKLFVWIISRVTNDFRVVLFFVHSFSFFCFWYFVKNMKTNCRTIVDWICVFLINTYLIILFCIMRSIITMSFIMVSFVLIEKNKKICALIVSLIALTFHNSAIIIIIAYFCLFAFEYLNIESIYKRFFLTVLLALLEFPFAFVGSKIYLPNSIYSSYIGKTGLAVNSYIAIMFVTVIVLYRFQYVKNKDFCKTTEFTDATLVMLGILCFPIQVYLSDAYRMVLLFIPMVYKMFSTAYTSYKLEKNGIASITNAVIVGIICFYLFYRCYTIFVTGEFVSYGLYPYEINI